MTIEMHEFYNKTPADRVLGEYDYEAASQLIPCDVPTTKAVVAVEAGSEGFMSDGRPKMLYEAHYFGALTGHVYDDTHPNISAPSWDRSLYGAGGAHQYDRLQQAMALNHDAALRSASWGLPQIMGDNYKAIGFTSVEEMVRMAVRSARDQLLMFVAFIKANGLADELQDKRWADFARVYNGPGYAANAYDTKLSDAHRQMLINYTQKVAVANIEVNATTGGTSTDALRIQIMHAQSMLNAEGYAFPPLMVDGFLGPRTAAALRQFQLKSGLSATGGLSYETQQALGLVQ